NFVAFARILLAFIIFIPFLRLKNIEAKFAGKLVLFGMFQYGVMYITYIYSFQFLAAHYVAIFTVFTPLYITLLNDILKRRFHPLFLFSALLAVVGMGIVVMVKIGQGDFLAGFLLVQVSNICFACGQVLYKREMNRRKGIKDRHIFALLYFGALVITAIGAGITTEWKNLSLDTSQLLTLLYLGVLASGICFFLWNYGARKTNIGALSVFNNIKVPLAVTCSILFFHEKGDIPRLILGSGIIIAALFINEFILKKSEK
ncbi:MAG: EamA family transporter, partial [Candidatus Aminicenantes bacterium]|nr:EamA family transporter [Candidatus Aminicenantes bacterium]